MFQACHPLHPALLPYVAVPLGGQEMVCWGSQSGAGLDHRSYFLSSRRDSSPSPAETLVGVFCHDGQQHRDVIRLPS